MYRSTKRRAVKNISRSAVAATLAAGVAVIGIGIAGASAHNSQALKTHHHVTAKADSPTIAAATTPAVVLAPVAHDATSQAIGTHVEGTVLSVSGSAISITSFDGTVWSVTVSSTTTMTMDDAPATLADVTPGASIEVTGSAGSTSGSLDAIRVSIDQNGASSAPQAGPVTTGDDQSNRTDGQGEGSGGYSSAPGFAAASGQFDGSTPQDSSFGGASGGYGD